MAANSTKTSEDTEMAECDGDKVVTMMDVLQEQEDFEEDANAVLGASDDKNCTYSKGYVKRQAIYACLTCCPDASSDPQKRAGVCLACSLNCHENHELVELYTKRNFRCDCGNPKFTQPCQFTPNKSDLNYENKYNQNFSGLYCSCHRPYPDPEASEEEEMIQCIICEDWLHTDHLEATVPLNEQYAEMICKDCMEDNDFLHDYSDLVVNVVDKEIIVTDPDLDVSSIIRKKKEEDTKENMTNGTTEAVINNDTNVDKNTPDSNDVASENKDKASADVDMSEKKPDESEVKDNIEAKEEINITEQQSEEKATEENATSTDVSNDDIDKDKDLDKGSNKDDEKQDTEADCTKKTNENLDDESNKTVTEKNTEISTTDNKESLDSKETSANANEAEVSSCDKSSEDVESKTDVNEISDKENMSPTKKQENKRKLSTEEAEDTLTKKQKLDIKPCIRPRGVKRVYKGATFWPSTLRQKLCTCNECVAMYKDLAVLYLTDLEDTVTAYEALGKEKNDGAPSSQYEKGLQALSSLDRIQQINALTEYNKMRDKLLDFLKSFKERKEVVKEEDIKAFFAGMKPKREPDGVYFCR